jgi:uncharacterized membrane protein
MRYAFVLLAVLGIIFSSFALREHYRTEDSPCHINDVWDCGEVNHSPYAMLFGVPVAIFGIAWYLGIAVLALRRAYRLVLAATLVGLAFSLYLAHIEKDVIRAWCIYCVGSLGVISIMTLMALGVVAWHARRKPASTFAQNRASEM